MSDTIKEGNMVQVWDHSDAGNPELELTSHGRIGYAVKKEPAYDERLGRAREGNLWKVVFFDGGSAAYHHVHEEWLTVVNNASDIRKVDDDGV